MILPEQHACLLFPQRSLMGHLLCVGFSWLWGARENQPDRALTLHRTDSPVGEVLDPMKWTHAAHIENLARGESRDSGVGKRKAFLEERGQGWVLQKPSASGVGSNGQQGSPDGVTSAWAHHRRRVAQFCDSSECANGQMSKSVLWTRIQ